MKRSNVLIDACPTCRGVWLDRGELDKILVRERQMAAGDPDDDFLREVEGTRAPAPTQHEREGDRYDHDRDRGRGKRKRRGFLEDLLDFD